MVLVHSASFSKNTEQTSNLQNKLLATSICAVPKTQPVDMSCLQSFLKKTKKIYLEWLKKGKNPEVHTFDFEYSKRFAI